jgi:hypothetical protein
MTPTTQQPAQQTQEAAQPQQPQQRRNIVDLMGIIAETDLRQQYTKDLIKAEIDRDAFDQDWRLARVFAMSGIFAEIKGQTQEQAIAQAMTKIQLGRSWGLSPADAMQFVFFTNGKPSVQNEVIASRMRDAGFDWDVDWHEEETSEKGRSWKRCVGCTVWLKKWNGKEFVPILDRNGDPVSVSFTKDDADHAMIWEKGQQIALSQKWNFVSWARDMYFWRCIARIKRFYATNVLTGVRTPEEAEEAAPAEVEIPKNGSVEAAEAVAARKIAQMQKRSLAQGETSTAQRDARHEKQSEEQLAAARSKEEEKTRTAEDLGVSQTDVVPSENRPLTDEENTRLNMETLQRDAERSGGAPAKKKLQFGQRVGR